MPTSDHRRGQKHQSSLPVVDCSGCGVCCLHMGYPTFIQPAAPRSLDEIRADPELARLAKHPSLRKQLQAGLPGEIHWQRLPENLKAALVQYIAEYQHTPGQLDGPCYWYDAQTRKCKHHPYRPRVCREYQVNSPGCRQWRSHYRDHLDTPPDQ